MRCGSRSAGVWVRCEPVKVAEIDGTGGLASPKQYQQRKLGTLIISPRCKTDTEKVLPEKLHSAQRGFKPYAPPVLAVKLALPHPSLTSERENSSQTAAQ